MPLRGAVFPNVAPTEYSRQPELLQTRVDVPFGDPQINVPHPFVKTWFSWNSTFLTPADLVTLETWFTQNGTTFFSFYEAESIWRLVPISLTLVGNIVGGVMTYTLPGKLLAGLQLWDNTATLINPSRYTVSPGTGPEGEDQITFNVGQLPVVGHSLSYTATSGAKKYTVWCNTKRFPTVHAGEGDLFALDEPLQFEEKIT